MNLKKILQVFAVLLIASGLYAINPEPCPDPWVCVRDPVVVITGDSHQNEPFECGDLITFSINVDFTQAKAKRCDEVKFLGDYRVVWEVTGPNGKVAKGEGETASFMIDEPGNYTCDFTVKPVGPWSPCDPFPEDGRSVNFDVDCEDEDKECGEKGCVEDPLLVWYEGKIETCKETTFFAKMYYSEGTVVWCEDGSDAGEKPDCIVEVDIDINKIGEDEDADGEECADAEPPAPQGDCSDENKDADRDYKFEEPGLYRVTGTGYLKCDAPSCDGGFEACGQEDLEKECIVIAPGIDRIEADGTDKTSEGDDKQERTVYLANDHLDETKPREEVEQGFTAYMDPEDAEVSDCYQWTGAEEQGDKLKALFKEKDHGEYEVSFGNDCDEKSMFAFIAGVDVQHEAVSASEEEDSDKYVPVFLNDNFSKDEDKDDPPCHTDCKEIDHTIEEIDPQTDELTEITLKFEKGDDEEAEAKLTGFSGNARIYLDGEVYEEGEWKNIDDYWDGATILMEGIALGSFTLEAHIKTQDDFEAKDSLNFEVVRVNAIAKGPEASKDEHEICDNKLFVRLNNDDDDEDNTIDLDDSSVSTGDDELGELELAKPEGGKEEDFEGDFTLDVPSSLKLWEDEKKSVPAKSGYPYKELPITLYVEGVEESSDWNEEDLVVEVELRGGSMARDNIKYSVLPADIDVDSDNTVGFEAPERDSEEDEIEFRQPDEEYPGKIVVVNDGDWDGDQVPDFADGINKHDNEGVDASRNFYSLVLEIPDFVDTEKAKIKLEYDASDPDQVTRTGAGTAEDPYQYAPATGALRIWMKDGEESREVKSVADDGDYIPTGEELSAEDLFTGSESEVTLFIESIAESEEIGDQEIIISMDIDGSSGDAPMLEFDAVRLSSIRIAPHLVIASSTDYLMQITKVLPETLDEDNEVTFRASDGQDEEHVPYVLDVDQEAEDGPEEKYRRIEGDDGWEFDFFVPAEALGQYDMIIGEGSDQELVIPRAIAVIKVRAFHGEMWALTDEEHPILEFEAPHLSDEVKKEWVDSWSIEWDIEPNAFLLEADGSGAFTRLADDKIPSEDYMVRILAARVDPVLDENDPDFDKQKEALTGLDRYHYQFGINTPNLEEAGLEQALGYVLIKRREWQVELHADDVEFIRTPAPWGGTTLYGAKARVALADDGPKPNLQPDGDVIGSNDQFAVSYWDQEGEEAAPILGWNSASEFEVGGQKLGDTFIQITPVVDGSPVDPGNPASELPIVVDAMTMSEPSRFYLDVAKANMLQRAEIVNDNRQEYDPIPTPVPPENGEFDAFWKLPTSYRFSGANYPKQTSRTKEVDSIFEWNAYMLAQIVPAADAERWHEPLSGGDSVYQLEMEPEGYTNVTERLLRLSLSQYARIFNDGEPLSQDQIGFSLRLAGPPLDLWARAKYKPVESGYQVRSDEDALDDYQTMETKAMGHLDQMALARLKRYFSLDFEGNLNDFSSLVSEYDDQNDPVVGPLTHMGQDASLEGDIPWWWKYMVPLGVVDSVMFGLFDDWLKGDATFAELMDTQITPGWHIGHNFSTDIVRWMIAERLQLVKERLDAIDSSYTPGSEGYPITIEYISSSIFESWSLAAVAALSELPMTYEYDEDGTTQTPGRVRFHIPEQYTFEDFGYLKLYRNGTQFHLISFDVDRFGDLKAGGYHGIGYESLNGLKLPLRGPAGAGSGGDIYYVDLKGHTISAAAVVRMMHEVHLLEGMLADHGRLAFYEAAEAHGPWAYWIYTVGDYVVPISDFYRAIIGRDLESNEQLSATERMVSAAFVAVEFVPVVGTATKGSIRAWKVAGKNLGHDVRRTGLDSAQSLGSDVQRTASKMADDGTNIGSKLDASAPGKQIGLSTLLSKFGNVKNIIAEDFALTLRNVAGLRRFSPRALVMRSADAPVSSAAHGVENAGKRNVQHPEVMRNGDRGNNPRSADEAVSQRTLEDSDQREVLDGLTDPEEIAVNSQSRIQACFTAGTQVAMADGSLKPISEIAVGDQVWARDQHQPTGPMVAKTVTRVFRRDSHELTLIKVIDPERREHLIETTPEHPFFTSTDGWAEAADLLPGERLLGRHEGWMVKEVAHRESDVPTPVFNFEVADAHTYFVQTQCEDPDHASLIWVHNRCWINSLADSYVNAVAARKSLTRTQKNQYRRQFVKAIKKWEGGLPAASRDRFTNAGKEQSRKDLNRFMEQVSGVNGLKPKFAAAHHLVPVESYSQYKDWLDELGFELNHPGNGCWMNTFGSRFKSGDLATDIHASGHPGFNQAVSEAIERMRGNFDEAVSGAPELRGELIAEYQQKMRDMQTHIRDQIYRRKPVWIRGKTQAAADIWKKELEQFE